MNRNKIIILNGIIVAFTTMLNAVLGMVEVSMILKYFGSTVNGLIQTGNQVLNYVSLIEAGLSAAFLYKMYRPIAEDNNVKLSSLYTGFRKSMGITVNKMLLVALLVSSIYPLFIKNNRLTYSYMLTIFILLSLKVILPYKVTMVPKYMLVVKEKKYKAEFISGISRAITSVTTISLMIFNSIYNIDMPIQILLISGILISLLTGFWFEKEMNKIFRNILNKKAEPDITPNRMSKDITVHNISRMVFSSTDNIIISTLGTLQAVTIYSSYNMVVGQVTELAQKFMDGVTASMGIKIAKRDTNSYYIYREMISASLWIGGIICSIFVIMMNDFVALWIGEEYCVSSCDLILFSLVLYCGIILPCIQVTRNASGLYKESKNFTLIQAIVNLIITLLMVPKFGITGALIGTVFSRLTITVPCNCKLVDRKVFPSEKSRLIDIVIGYVIMTGISILGLYITSKMPVLELNILIQFIFKTIVVSSIVIIFYTTYYWAINTGFREFIGRILGMINNKR